jgi:hypothetical protein
MNLNAISSSVSKSLVNLEGYLPGAQDVIRTTTSIAVSAIGRVAAAYLLSTLFTSHAEAPYGYCRDGQEPDLSGRIVIGGYAYPIVFGCVPEYTESNVINFFEAYMQVSVPY